MKTLTLKLSEEEHRMLKVVSALKGLTIKSFILSLVKNTITEEDLAKDSPIASQVNNWLKKLEESNFDVTRDPIYNMEGFDSDAPADLSINHDKYIYGKGSENV
ncbi:MAG TPA: hypothetical protein PL110_03680 [Candidatus Eremiobacteraeota bacterium]|nr:MAG: hypothetical protein BWY64_03215 [bacterium ADurb.Bin363]HPZ07187.1 hypothetical protein [Candidatus Eremiobacteraeota bacterium]